MPFYQLSDLEKKPSRTNTKIEAGAVPGEFMKFGIVTKPEGEGPPLHEHPNEEQFTMILAGQMHFVLGEIVHGGDLPQRGFDLGRERGRQVLPAEKICRHEVEDEGRFGPRRREQLRHHAMRFIDALAAGITRRHRGKARARFFLHEMSQQGLRARGKGLPFVLAGRGRQAVLNLCPKRGGGQESMKHEP